MLLGIVMPIIVEQSRKADSSIAVTVLFLYLFGITNSPSKSDAIPLTE